MFDDNAPTLEIELPKKLHFLLNESARFKVLLGGRGSAKTESCARALIIFASQMRLRIACFRELQNSIDESSYSTIKNVIIDTWKDGSWFFEWDIQKTTIISKRTASEFIFSGLRYKIDSVKSMARIDIAWVDEARNCSKTTLDKLAPTIRGLMVKDDDGNRRTAGGPFGKGPEIWYSYNPELDSDEIYKRTVKQKEKYFPDYVENAETGEKERYAIVVKVNWQDNRFFPEDLRQQMAVMRAAAANDEEDTEYLHVWEGHTKQVLEGAIYAKEIKKIIKEERRKRVPYNPLKSVLTYWDLGHSDKTAIWFMQYNGMEYNFIHYYENRLQKMGHYIEYLQELKYIYTVHNIPHDGDAETLSNVTPRKQLQAAFPNAKVRVIERPSKKIVGINAVRTVLDLCNFDEDNTADGWACMCNYAYKVNEDNGQFSKEPDHDTPWSHGADGLQTFGLSIKPEKEPKKEKSVGSNKNSIRNLHRGTGWMA